MIQKTDLILLLTEMQEQGINVSSQLKKTLISSNIPIDVLKFINDNRQLDVAAFYERMRKNYNTKKSPLYINIVKEIEDPTEVITTLSALALQISLYSKHVDNKTMFFKHTRVSEILSCLSQYYSDYDITKSLKLIRLIKADLKAFEEIR
jgi:hypothetical protein